MRHVDGGPSLFIDAEPAPASVAREVAEGLASQPPSLPPKLFYDERGSILFDEICRLDEYYPTRTETAIMQDFVEEMADAIGSGAVVIEYGSGSSLKTEALLSALHEPEAYLPIDISREHLLRSAARIAHRHPELKVLPVCADYTSAIPGLAEFAASRRSVVYFPGSTIGNFEPSEAQDFLGRIARLVGPGGGLLIGVDLRKDPCVLESAYNDAKGVTAAFNLNMLRHINDRLGPTFELDAFQHRAVWNDSDSRIEMHLVASRPTQVRVNGHALAFETGERIVTEHSYKFTRAGFAELAGRAGWTVQRVWTDPQELFSVQYLSAGS